MEPVRITQQQIRNKIKKLRKDAAPGPDRITPGLLQKLEDTVLQPLEIIFNMSVNSGISPQDWKKATVTPILRKERKVTLEIIDRSPLLLVFRARSLNQC
jgi:hypothetical protein